MFLFRNNLKINKISNLGILFAFIYGMNILLKNDEIVFFLELHNMKIIESYICKHFSNYSITDNSILIKYENKNIFYRTVLIKWLYRLYIRNIKKELPYFKERILKRKTKNIRIILNNNIKTSITWKVVDKNCVKFRINPYKSEIINYIKNYFNTTLERENGFFILKIPDRKKHKFKHLLLNNQIKTKPIHIYNKKSIEQFISDKKTTIQTSIEEAYETFELSRKIRDIQLIKEKYLKLAKIYHPDMQPHKDEESIKMYTKKFQDIIKAYELLKTHSLTI